MNVLPFAPIAHLSPTGISDHHQRCVGKTARAFSSQRRFFRWQSVEAQTSTAAELAPPHNTAHKLRHQLLSFRSSTSLGRWQLCFAVIRTHQHRPRHSNRRLGQTLTLEQMNLIRCSDITVQSDVASGRDVSILDGGDVAGEEPFRYQIRGRDVLVQRREERAIRLRQIA